MSNSPPLVKAVLIPMNGNQMESDENHIVVQFNPTSLRVTLSNTIKADDKGGPTTNPAQYIDKSESSLSVQLIFDTTVPGAASGSATGDANDIKKTETGSRRAQANHEANSDVRLLTKAIADVFMVSQNPNAEKPSAPKRCRFQWGAFAFEGLVSSYNETLDYFSPEGVPLRSTLALTLKEDRYQFEVLNVKNNPRNLPSFAPGGSNISAASAARTAQKKPEDWRELALFNGLENPRVSESFGLSIPNVSLSSSAGISAKAGLGFNVGKSAELGTSIPGAFSLKTEKIIKGSSSLRLDAFKEIEG